MNQPKVKYSLSNWDLVTVNPNYKTWNWKDLFCFWGVNVQSVIGFSLIASLYLLYSLNTFINPKAKHNRRKGNPKVTPIICGSVLLIPKLNPE